MLVQGSRSLTVDLSRGDAVIGLLAAILVFLSWIIYVMFRFILDFDN